MGSHKFHSPGALKRVPPGALREYILISLDILRETVHNIK